MVGPQVGIAVHRKQEFVSRSLRRTDTLPLGECHSAVGHRSWVTTAGAMGPPQPPERHQGSFLHGLQLVTLAWVTWGSFRFTFFRTQKSGGSHTS